MALKPSHRKAISEGLKRHHAKKNKRWIQGAIKHPGALHKQLGIGDGKKIPMSLLHKAAKGSGKLAQRARLAITLQGMRKRKGKA